MRVKVARSLKYHANELWKKGKPEFRERWGSSKAIYNFLKKKYKEGKIKIDFNAVSTKTSEPA